MVARQVNGKSTAEQRTLISSTGGRTPRGCRVVSCECAQGLEDKIVIAHRLKYAARGPTGGGQALSVRNVAKIRHRASVLALVPSPLAVSKASAGSVRRVLSAVLA
jgi:hypothetical protein